MIDSYTEYPYYQFNSTLEKMNQSPAIPDSYQELVTELLDFKEKTIDKKEILAWKQNRYVKYWLDVKSDPAKRTNLANDFMNSESSRGASIGFPSGPIIINKFAYDLFEVTKEMNRICKAIWKDGECPTSIVMEPECVSNSDFMESVLDWVQKEKSHTIFKIKNNDLTKRTQTDRDRYRYFQEEIARIKREENKIFMLLEAGPQAYPSAVLGFDVISTSLKAYDLDSQFGKSVYEGKGSWYDPQFLKLHNFGEVEQIFKNFGKLPCPCEPCKQITSLEAITRDFWNVARRKHYILTMNRFMEEIRQKIRERHIEQTREKLLTSEMCILKTLIPTS